DYYCMIWHNSVYVFF
nr:immunoglobulin light chain junction region [Macaca mulatta]MOX12601.1 immunoglobulin light chain junction region [Macaca mulatta]MOX13711.1 immunoglobulin light chain junction region [Macaca mulatta]MOX13877.1 immunoglobulin light chain junction region [Macaca mulatta]